MRSSLRGATDTIDINSLRLEEKAASVILRSDLGFDVARFFERWFRFGDSGFVLIRLEIRSNSAEFGSSSSE